MLRNYRIKVGKLLQFYSQGKNGKEYKENTKCRTI